MFQKNSYCSYCGHPFEADQAWPRPCAHCHNITFLNPTPIVVMLLPVDEGLLVIRRGIPPQQGWLALPGGFIDYGESWQEAGAREVWEETGIRLDPLEIAEFAVRSTPRGDQILIFGLAQTRAAATLPPFEPSDETTERAIIMEPVELAFPLHTEVVKSFFNYNRTYTVDRFHVISNPGRGEKSLDSSLANKDSRDFSSQAPRNDMNW